MTLNLMLRRLVNKLEAAGVLVSGEAFEAAESGAARGAGVIGWKAAHGTEASLGEVRGGRLSRRVIGSVGIRLPIFLQQLHERLAVLHSVVVGTARLPPLPGASRRVQVVVELRHLLRQHQIGVRIVVVVVQLQLLECLLRSPLARHLVQHSLLIRILNPS